MILSYYFERKYTKDDIKKFPKWFSFLIGIGDGLTLAIIISLLILLVR